MSRSRRAAGRQQNRPAVVSNLPQNQSQASHPERRFQVTERVEFRSGPLPSAQELAEYDTVVPGAAERILVMAEKQSDHRRALERTVITGDNYRAYLGMVIGAALQGGVFFATYKLGQAGHESVAIALGTGGSVTGLSTIWASWRRSQERSKRSQESS